MTRLIRRKSITLAAVVVAGLMVMVTGCPVWANDQDQSIGVMVVGGTETYKFIDNPTRDAAIIYWNSNQAMYQMFPGGLAWTCHYEAMGGANYISGECSLSGFRFSVTLKSSRIDREDNGMLRVGGYQGWAQAGNETLGIRLISGNLFDEKIDDLITIAYSNGDIPDQIKTDLSQMGSQYGYSISNNYGPAFLRWYVIDVIHPIMVQFAQHRNESGQNIEALKRKSGSVAQLAIMSLMYFQQSGDMETLNKLYTLFFEHLKAQGK